MFEDIGSTETIARSTGVNREEDLSESAHEEAHRGAERAQGDTGREETEEERADRKWGDLLQEIRVAQTGVQILFGFLLTVVFTPRYTQLEQVDRTIYIVTVVLGASATGALIGPVSLHRIVAGRRVKERAVVWASRMTLAGLVLLLATMTASLLLILRVATHDGYVPWIVTGIVAWYLVCWFAVPLWVRNRHTTS
ncbi:DUF6328 family protein [Streptomyces sp. NPDC059466]|uniref:DUF6328 family protein n=1 Tax=unclassified Streptomyces TaxID=2593676 RepID=UPI0036797A65